MKSTPVILLLAAALFLPVCVFAADFSEVETAILQKDYAKARDLSQELTKQSLSPSEHEEAVYYLGLSQLRLEQYAEARDSFLHLVKNSHDAKMRDKASISIIDSYYMEGQYSEALTRANDLLRESPQSELLCLMYLKLARSNLKLAQWDKAKGYLKKIITQFPDSPEASIAKQLLEEEQYFAVQLGAFLDRAHAESLVEELKEKGEYAYIVETTDRENRKFYRVRVGQMAALNDAQDLKNRLAKFGYPTIIYP